MGYIYGLSCSCHPERPIRYIGKTTQQMQVRLRQHFWDAQRYGRLPVHHWINKHGSSNICVTILQECDDPVEILLWESMWISRYRDEGFELLNLTDGGDGHSGFRPTAETLALRSKKMSGRKMPEEQKQKIGNSNRGKTRSAEVRLAWSISRTGKIASEESKRKVSISGRLRWKDVRPEDRGFVLSHTDVLEIVNLCRRGERRVLIAERYGVNVKTISHIMTGRSWSAITGIAHD